MSRRYRRLTPEGLSALRKALPRRKALHPALAAALEADLHREALWAALAVLREAGAVVAGRVAREGLALVAGPAPPLVQS